MSFHNNTFLADPALRPAVSEREIDIPPHPLKAGKWKAQPYGFSVGSQLLLFSKDSRKTGFMVVVSRDAYSHEGEKFMLKSTSHGFTLFMSDWQIAIMERQGRLKPLYNLANDKNRPPAPLPSELALSREDHPKAVRREKYVLALIEARKPVWPSNHDTQLVRKLVEATTLEVARELGELEKVPCYNSVMWWLRRYEAAPFNRLAALAMPNSRGNRTERFEPWVEKIISACVQWTWEMPKGTSKDTFEKFELELADPKYLEDLKALEKPDGTLKLPRFRTIQRRFLSVNLYVRDVWRKGEDYARRKHGFYTGRELPDHPLGIVEVDYATADMIVYDEEFKFVYGRPHLLVFIDKKTGSILGFALHFDNQSYEAFLFGLRQMIYPHDMSEYPGLVWFQYGIPICMVVDNASFFIGDDMRAACTALGIQLLETIPGVPEGKGTVERIFRTINQQVFHKLKGTTLSNTELRKEFDKEKGLGLPVITIKELERFIVAWICQYHQEPRQGLGKIPKFHDTPNLAFERGLKELHPRDPIDPELFVSLAGSTEYLTIQNDGVTWDHITYVHPDLVALTTHPDHRGARSGVETTRYKCSRDPSDLAYIWVTDPYRNVTIKVPASGPCRAYADGLRLAQHRAVVRHHNSLRKREPTTIEDLIWAKNQYSKKLSELHQIAKSQKSSQMVGKFLSNVTRKLHRSSLVHVLESAEASEDRLNFSDPFAPDPARPKSIHNPESTAGSPETHVVVNEDGVPETQDVHRSAIADHRASQRKRTEQSGPRTESAKAAERGDPDRDTRSLDEILNELGFEE